MTLYNQHLAIAKKLLFVAILVLLLEICLPQYVVAIEMQQAYSQGPGQFVLVSGTDENIRPAYSLPSTDEKQPSKTMYVTATAYSSTVDQCDSTPFITANGTFVHDGIIAANFLPFGTKVKIPELYGDKVFSVEDRMNSKYHYRVDVWMTTREEAIQFGSKYIQIEIYQ